jgi:hypothetical protein
LIKNPHFTADSRSHAAVLFMIFSQLFPGINKMKCPFRVTGFLV